jgi:hypothetical protein
MLGKPPFDLRDFPAQGKNGLLRQGGCRHDGLLPGLLFLLCSYRFQRPTGESSESLEEFIPQPSQ